MDTLDKLAVNWPSPIVARSEISRFSGGALAPRTLANCDSLGIGPKERFMIGKKTVYPVASMVEWLRQRTKPVKSSKNT